MTDDRMLRFAAEIAALRKEVRGLSVGPQLAYSAIEDGAVREFDIDGQLVQQVGAQFDGTHMAASLVGPVPPAPATPVLEVRAGGLAVIWNGLFVDDAIVPMDFARVEIHASLTPDFDPSFADTIRGTFETPRGGEYVITLPATSVFYVKLVARSLTGKRSAPSGQASGQPGLVGVDSLSPDVVSAMRPIQKREGVGKSTTSGTYTPTAVTVDDAGLVFVAPPSGTVDIRITALMRSQVANAYCKVDYQIRTGNAVGAGALVYSGDTAVSTCLMATTSVNFHREAGLSIHTGLTPGDTYNVYPVMASHDSASLVSVAGTRLIIAPTL